ncbi:MAG: T9SS type A sorting domain-containing protein [Brumimicrobium sp.]|nr:T9SS type A sorting domain-containing protein [Brumimicrobium sp.]
MLTANQNGATYQWIDCNNNNEPIAGAINQVFEPTQTGDYAVIITEGSCSEQSDCIHVETLGMDEVMTNKWNIYPNPVQDKLFIASDVTSTITLYDVTGKIILSTIIHSGVETLDVKSLTPGVYVIKSELGKVSKFVKK